MPHKPHSSHPKHKRNVLLNNPAICSTCKQPYFPRAYNQLNCDDCRIQAGVMVYPNVEPTKLESFYESECERRFRLAALKKIKEQNQ